MDYYKTSKNKNRMMDISIFDFKITIAIVVVITIFQVIAFLKTTFRQIHFKRIFPKSVEDNLFILNQECSDVVQITTKEFCRIATEKEKIEELIKTQKAEVDKISKKIRQLESRIVTPNYDKVNYLSEIEAQQQRKEELDSLILEEKKQLRRLKEEEKNKLDLRTTITNETMFNIVYAINRYLKKNKDSVADFNIINDIINRNSDAVEEEIQSQIPIPIFFGLMGTMLGIIIGAGELVFSGALEHLLTPFTPSVGVELGTPAYDVEYAKYNAISTDGINSLFGGVAIATFSSIFGIILNVISTYVGKNIKYSVESKKHAFLSWLQAELLPKISSDFSSALIKLGNDLTRFNNSFSSNADLLKSTISTIGDTTVAQSRILQTIDELDISQITQIVDANIAVYAELKNCTKDIANLAQDLQTIQQNIRDVGNYMQDGIKEYERRNTYIQDASGKVDIAINEGHQNLQQATTTMFEKYNDLLNTLYLNTQQNTNKLADRYTEEAEKIHNAIIGKLSDFKQIEVELKNLVAIKTSMGNLERVTSSQNQKIDVLSQAIKELAQVKMSGGATHIEMKIPKFYKIIITIVAVIISMTSLFFITLRILEMFNISL